MSIGLDVFRDAFQQAREAMLLSDGEFAVLAVNDACAKLLDLSVKDFVGHPVQELKSERHDEAFYTGLWDRIRRDGEWYGEIWCRRGDGQDVLCSISVGRTETRKAGTHYLWIIRDFTELRAEFDRNEYLASHDALTGLPNRLLLIDRLQRICAHCQRTGDPSALLLIDLEGFGAVSDTLGQVVADGLISQVAERLRRAIRQSDTIARLDGQEFAIILAEIADARDAELVARKILDQLSQEFLVDGNQIYISGNVGLTVMPEDGNAWTRIIRNADVALLSAKKAGQATIRFFTEGLNIETSLRAELERELRDGLQRDEFRLRYQPIVETVAQGLVATEALIRWHHPDRGIIGPDDFIGTAEETGLMTGIGRWVFNQVVTTLAGWRDAGIPLCRVTINLSDRQLRAPEAFDEPLSRMKQLGLAPELIEVEVSEAVLRDKTESVHRSLKRLSEFGIGLVVDDFDTGYTTQRLMRRFPIRSLRIERSFVRNIEEPENGAIVTAMIQLAKSLGIQVVGKGVENEKQHNRLREQGCDCVQGYLISHPLEEPEMRRLLVRMAAEAAEA
jgi:diguanylate cyclase (GGDEF)-like protein/PAS domain S-box-containing protein